MLLFLFDLVFRTTSAGKAAIQPQLNYFLARIKFKMGRLNIVFLVAFASINFISPVTSELKPLQGKVISGLYYEETTQFLPYTKVVPVVFEFKLKSDFWRGGTINNAFQLLPRLNCRYDSLYPILSTSDWYFTCPVFFHIHQLLQILRSNYTDIYPTARNVSPSYGPQESQKFNSKMKFEDCDSVLQKMWKGVSSYRDVGFSEYKGMLEKCSTMPVYVEDKIQDTTVDNFSSTFDRIENNFASAFFLNSSDPGELVNNLLALQGIQLQIIYAELSRFREAVLSCQNHLIPPSFVKPSRLEKAILDLRPKLIQMRHAMSTQSISKLYKLPIADCIFSGTSLIVQVLLPVVRSESLYTLLQVHSPLFLYANRLCKVFPGESSSASGKMVSDDEPPSKHYLYEKTQRLVVATGCTTGDEELCFIPDQASRPLINRCIYSVLNGSLTTNDVRDFCELQCEDKPLSEEYAKLIIPIIQRISSNKFVIAVNRITTLLIKCEGKPDEMVTPQEYGAVEVSLACGCYLMWHSEKFDARVPCANSVMVRHVVPEHMLNQSTPGSANKFFLISNLGDRINSTLIRAGNDGLVDNWMELTTPMPGIRDFDGNSLSVLNHSMQIADEYYGACYGGFTHTFLWIAVALETTLFLAVALYLYCKIYEMNKKLWSMGDRTAVTYCSAAHLTNNAYE